MTRFVVAAGRALRSPSYYLHDGMHACNMAARGGPSYSKYSFTVRALFNFQVVTREYTTTRCTCSRTVCGVGLGVLLGMANR
eukprot:1334711-Prymnesium_polylepis.2